MHPPCRLIPVPGSCIGGCLDAASGLPLVRHLALSLKRRWGLSSNPHHAVRTLDDDESDESDEGCGRGHREKRPKPRRARGKPSKRAEKQKQSRRAPSPSDEDELEEEMEVEDEVLDEPDVAEEEDEEEDEGNGQRGGGGAARGDLTAAHALADALLLETARPTIDDVVSCTQRDEAEVEKEVEELEEVEEVEDEDGEANDRRDDDVDVADRALKQAERMRAEQQSVAEEKRAMEARIARLEMALASQQVAASGESGGPGASKQIGTMVRALGDLTSGGGTGGDTGFHFAIPLSTSNPPGAGGNDDSFTMVGLTAQMAQRGEVAMSMQETSDLQDKRLQRLEGALRRKKEAEAQKEEAAAEEAKQEARRRMRKELLVIDNEIDAMTNGSTEGPTSHLIASKWLLELAYGKYPPRTFNARRAAQELQQARELRFRDAVLRALKLLQSRYAPEKNTVTQYGAEWAVMAEEIAKHAFALQAGMTRGAKQGLLNRDPVFANSFPMRHGGDDDFGVVEDAD